jgi:hypothetical protein
VRRFLFVSAAFCFSLIAAPVRAWGELGHELVGALAQRQLTAQASARVAELLRDEADPTLAGVAYWADTLRGSDPERFKATARWHFVNVQQGNCHYFAARDCPDGACIVEAIETQRRLLRDFSQPFEVRRDALKFLVHLVGDVHQPLHASNRSDKGANEFQIALRTEIPPEEYARDRYVSGVMGTNLHSVWDYYILESAKLPLRAYADRLAKSMRPSTGRRADPSAWAEESCELIDKRRLYPRSHEMNAAYLLSARPLAERRVVVAAKRLAQLLNEVLTLPPSR